MTSPGARHRWTSDRQITMDALSVGAPVLDGRGQVVAAVSLVAHHDTAPAHALAPLVRTSARAISRVLAHPPRPD